MREIRTSGSEGGAGSIPVPTPMKAARWNASKSSASKSSASKSSASKSSASKSSASRYITQPLAPTHPPPPPPPPPPLLLGERSWVNALW
jgi:hypothetical protein